MKSTKSVRNILGSNIAKYRKLKGLTQEQLSEMLEVTPKHLSNIESGRKFASATLLDKMIEVLKIAPSALLYSPDFSADLDASDLGMIDRIIDQHTRELKAKIHDEIEDYCTKSDE